MSEKKNTRKKKKNPRNQEERKTFIQKNLPTNQRSCRDGPGNLANKTLMTEKKTQIKDKIRGKEENKVERKKGGRNKETSMNDYARHQNKVI